MEVTKKGKEVNTKCVDEQIITLGNRSSVAPGIVVELKIHNDGRSDRVDEIGRHVEDEHHGEKRTPRTCVFSHMTKKPTKLWRERQSIFLKGFHRILGLAISLRWADGLMWQR